MNATFWYQEKVFDKILSPGRVNMQIAIEKVEFHFLGYLWLQIVNYSF
jgi:hypothetical protein